jgi:hypothetical protein
MERILTSMEFNTSQTMQIPRNTRETKNNVSMKLQSPLLIFLHKQGHTPSLELIVDRHA